MNKEKKNSTQAKWTRKSTECACACECSSVRVCEHVSVASEIDVIHLLSEGIAIGRDKFGRGRNAILESSENINGHNIANSVACRVGFNAAGRLNVGVVDTVPSAYANTISALMSVNFKRGRSFKCVFGFVVIIRPSSEMRLPN